MTQGEKKKVLFLITKSNWGGAQRYVYDLATNLDPDRFAVTVALGGDGALIEKLEHAGIRVVRIPGLQRDISLKKELLSTWEIHKLLRAERPDIFHVNSSKAGVFGAFLGRWHRIPRIIFTAHGWAFNEDRPSWQRFFFKAMHWLTVFLSHRTIAVSTAIKTQLDWPGVANRFVVIPLGIDATLPLLDEAAARDKIVAHCNLTETLPPETVWLGTVAELHPVKRHIDMIEAVATLIPFYPNLHYFIVGDGQLRKDLEKLVRQLAVGSHVHFAGAMMDAYQLMPAFDIFMLASASEAGAYVLLEAGLAARPVVATRVGGIPELINNDTTGRLVDARDVYGLHVALKAYLEQPETKTRYGTALKETVTTDRSLTAMTAATVAAYQID